MADSIITRQACLRDIDSVMQVEREAWREGIRASRGQFVERLKIFPEGFFVGELKGEIVGALTAQRLVYELGETPAGWEKTTNRGWISATHQASGNALYIVSVGVARPVQRHGVGAALVCAAQDFAKKEKLEYIILDSRLPEYRPFYESGVSPEDYVARLSSDPARADSELRFYHRLGFKVFSPSQIIGSCMSNDTESASYGVRMIWINKP
jgi:ribosomal protein S18 acetylase RimI-like enzyme